MDNMDAVCHGNQITFVMMQAFSEVHVNSKSM